MSHITEWIVKRWKDLAGWAALLLLVVYVVSCMQQKSLKQESAAEIRSAELKVQQARIKAFGETHGAATSLSARLCKKKRSILEDPVTLEIQEALALSKPILVSGLVEDITLSDEKMVVDIEANGLCGRLDLKFKLAANIADIQGFLFENPNFLSVPTRKREIVFVMKANHVSRLKYGHLVTGDMFGIMRVEL